MEHLEKALFNYDLVVMSTVYPVSKPGRKYGVMIYYYKGEQRRMLLTAVAELRVELSSRLLTQDEWTNTHLKSVTIKGMCLIFLKNF